MKYSITLVKITKNVSSPVSINFVSLACEPSLLVLRHDRCFGTIVTSARSLLRHDRCFGTIVASARSLLRHDRCFGTIVASARSLLRHERCFGTSIALARALLRHERFFARGKVRGLEQRESVRGQQGVWHLIISARLSANLSPLLVSNISAGRETRVLQR